MTRPSTRSPKNTSSKTSKNSSPSPSWSRNTAASPAACSGPSPANPSPKNSSPASSASTDPLSLTAGLPLAFDCTFLACHSAAQRRNLLRPLLLHLPLPLLLGKPSLQAWLTNRRHRTGLKPLGYALLPRHHDLRKIRNLRKGIYELIEQTQTHPPFIRVV